MIALNNFFILRPYQQGQGIKTEMRGGLALPGQKLNLVALELVADSKVEGNSFKAGDVALIAEDLLMTHDWAKKVRRAPGVDGEFIVVESRYVSAVQPSKDSE